MPGCEHTYCRPLRHTDLPAMLGSEHTGHARERTYRLADHARERTYRPCSGANILAMLKS
eukprot:11730825-Prorocentrum_lima.AAC.1